MGFVRIVSTANDYRREFTRLPNWGRLIIGLFAIPGIVLILLSILMFVVSIAALLLLTVPVYRLLAVLTARAPTPETSLGAGFMSPVDPTRRRVDVRIVE
jgi:hypothetical protein